MVRRAEAPLCADLSLPTGMVAPDCVCSPGAFCLSRPQMEKVDVVLKSERVCRRDLEAERNKPPVVADSGWSTAEVVGLVVGVGLGALALGFVAGIIVEKFR